MTATYSAIERNKKPAGALEIPEDFDFYYLNKKDRQMSLAWRIPGRGSLVGCRLWGRTESDTTEVT